MTANWYGVSFGDNKKIEMLNAQLSENIQNHWILHTLYGSSTQYINYISVKLSFKITYFYFTYSKIQNQAKLINDVRSQESGYLWGRGRGKVLGGAKKGIFWRASDSPFLDLVDNITFSSVAQSCPTLYDPIDCSTWGFPVYHQLLELAQIHVHSVGDASQPSHPLSSPSPPAFSLSQHQDLFKWVSSLQQVAKVLEFQLQH